MRDEMDARLWTNHHESFSRSVNEGFRALQRKLRNHAPAKGAAGQLIAVVLAASFSLITIGGTLA